MTSLATPVQQVSFVIVDVETTGLDPRRDQIVEIGAAQVLGGQVVRTMDTLVSIGRAIPEEAQRIHKISNDMLIGQPPIVQAMAMLMAFIGEGVPVEHSHKSFDAGFLEHAHGKPLASTYLNTCTLSRRLFPLYRSHSLQECCRRHNIERQQQHRALGDALVTAQLLICLLEVGAARYPRLEDLAKIASIER